MVNPLPPSLPPPTPKGVGGVGGGWGWGVFCEIKWRTPKVLRDNQPPKMMLVVEAGPRWSVRQMLHTANTAWLFPGICLVSTSAQESRSSTIAEQACYGHAETAASSKLQLLSFTPSPSQLQVDTELCCRPL